LMDVTDELHARLPHSEVAIARDRHKLSPEVP
jgi:hypothetical protein